MTNQELSTIFIKSTDKKFLVKLVEFLNKVKVEPDSTTIVVQDYSNNTTTTEHK